jgi:23S rRNA (cytosine1962-C5)-methyltransferase
MSEGIITIKKGREKPIRQQHPWIFSGAIASAKDAQPGDIVTVVAHDGTFLARGYWNPKSQIQVRILTWQDEPIEDDWWRRMLKRAIDARLDLQDIHQNWDAMPCRLVNAENDFIPGLIIDCYLQENNSFWLVLQALTLGIDLRKALITKLLIELAQRYPSLRGGPNGKTTIDGIYERSDVDVRGKEGLPPITGVLWGDEPPEYFFMNENLIVDIRKGHKTGFYIDQEANRSILQDLVNMDATNIAYPATMLNLFSYTGAFGFSIDPYDEMRIVNVDSSRDALELADKVVTKHPTFKPEAFEFIEADVFEYLRDAVERGDQFDIIVCDPPKFAHNAQQVERAARGYKDLNLHCFKLIKPGGYLMTFSCSGAISADLFQKIVFGALADSGRQAQILKHLGPGDDHPVALTFPEGAYLKGLLLRVY